jgi:ATP-dependent RNA helicase HelY
MNPVAVAGLAGTRTYPLNSSFRPTYNMAVNLVGQVGRARAAKLLESSFAQFQADRGVVGLARQATKVRRQAVEIAVSCDRGDIASYDEIRRELGQLERDEARQRSSARRAEAIASLEQLRRGDIISVPSGRQAGVAVVLEPGTAPDGLPLPLVLTAGRQVRRVSVADFPAAVSPIERIRIPNSFSARSPAHRRDLASTVRNKVAGVQLPRHRRATGHSEDGEAAIAALRRRLRQHPCHSCPDLQLHLRDLERRARMDREADALEQRVSGRSHVLARTCGRVCSVLEQLGYMAGDEVTPEGRRLAALYTELDLLAAECLRRDTWAGLAPAELAACVSALTFESRRSDDASPPRLPHGRPREVLASMVSIWGELRGAEDEQHLAFLREPDLGFAWTVHAWARGAALDKLVGPDLTAGDFVRAVKQLIDVLGQLAVADGGGELAKTARSAIDALRRGVVAYSPVG